MLGNGALVIGTGSRFLATLRMTRVLVKGFAGRAPVLGDEAGTLTIGTMSQGF
jgi:hypothetical protein